MIYKKLATSGAPNRGPLEIPTNVTRNPLQSLPVSVNRNAPPDKKTRGNISLKNTKSGAGELSSLHFSSLLLQDLPYNKDHHIHGELDLSSPQNIC